MGVVKKLTQSFDSSLHMEIDMIEPPGGKLKLSNCRIDRRWTSNLHVL